MHEQIFRVMFDNMDKQTYSAFCPICRQTLIQTEFEREALDARDFHRFDTGQEFETGHPAELWVDVGDRKLKIVAIIGQQNIAL